METFLLIGSTFLIVVFLIAWIVTYNQKKKDQQMFINRISQADTELAKLIEENQKIPHILEQNDLLSKTVIDLHHKNSSLHDITQTTLDKLELLNSEHTTAKGNVTRFKNREKKLKIEVDGYVRKLHLLGYNVVGGIHDTNQDGTQQYLVNVEKIVPEAKPNETCNCMKPIKGVGNMCKQCRKPLK